MSMMGRSSVGSLCGCELSRRVSGSPRAERPWGDNYLWNAKMGFTDGVCGWDFLLGVIRSSWRGGFRLEGI